VVTILVTDPAIRFGSADAEAGSSRGPKTAPGLLRSPFLSQHQPSVWLYYRFALRFRDVEDLLAQRGIVVSYETIRQWCEKFGPGDEVLVNDSTTPWVSRTRTRIAHLRLESALQGFRSPGVAQRFLSLLAVTYNAFTTWSEAAGIAG